MTKCVVLWVNHKEAIIVSITDGIEQVVHLESSAKDKTAEERQGPLREHYRKVVAALQGAHEIFIFGTAQAKMDLKSEILKNKTLAHKIVGSQTVDTMTERGLVARAREICGLDEG